MNEAKEPEGFALVSNVLGGLQIANWRVALGGSASPRSW